MLTAEETRELETLAAEYPARPSACVEALKAVQLRRGWISDESLRDVAEFLGMTVEELDGVATFYPLIFRRPVGRHIIRVCDSVSCWIMGSDGFLRRLTEALGVGLGETTADGRFTLLPTACLGACDHAPALMIDGDLIGDLDGCPLEEILDRYP
jgi:NADH-quinone oxidoreductase subunit E